MSFDLVHIWGAMGPLAKSIAFVLLLMAIASVGVVVERFIAFAKANRQTKAFVAAAGPVIEAWDLDKMEQIATAKEHKASPIAQVFLYMTKSYLSAVEKKKVTNAVEMARNESERRLDAVEQDLRRGMNVLASVGSVAPFVGLLGTVVGIIGAFQGIGAAGSAGISVVSAQIGEALVETAFGLMVAIPAVLFYNYLSARVSSMQLSVTQSVGELLDEMEANHDSEEAKKVRAT